MRVFKIQVGSNRVPYCICIRTVISYPGNTKHLCAALKRGRREGRDDAGRLDFARVRNFAVHHTKVRAKGVQEDPRRRPRRRRSCGLASRYSTHIPYHSGMIQDTGYARLKRPRTRFTFVLFSSIIISSVAPAYQLGRASQIPRGDVHV